ncbi:MAG: hypothetical protein AB7F22_17685 [Reyranella sp.]|uniref:terminase small subunit-like protein n=1 Tax=Reyranella sp. TaxID=1929291 RepID=UPI003D139BC3
MAAKEIAYSTEIAAKIADYHADGKSVTAISKMPGMPERRVILQWLAEYDEFAEMMRQAKAAYVDALAEECLEIANNSTEDMKPDPDGLGFVVDRTTQQRDKLKIDTRMKLLEKWAPDRYGKGKAAGKGGGGPAAAPVKLTDNELARRIIFGLEQAQARAGEASGESAIVRPSARRGGGLA